MGEALAELPAVREAFAALSRSLKRIAVYRHARDQHGAYMEPAVPPMRELLEQRPSITVAVEPTALIYEGEAVHSEPARETGFLFRLHRDGVRSLSFRRGLGADELLAFAYVALADAQTEGGREDAVTELWKADLTHIGYSAITGYRMEETAGEQMERAVPQIAARAQEVIEKHVGASFAEDSQPLLWSEEHRKRRDPENWTELSRRAALTIIRIVEQDYAGWDLEALEEAFWRLVDQMLERGESQAAASALDRARKMAGSHANEFRLSVGRRLAEPARLERLAQIATGAERPPLFGAWLGLLPPEAGPAILGVLPLGRDAPARLAIASAALARLESCRAQLDDLLKRGTVAEAAAVLAGSSALPAGRRAELAAAAIGNVDLNVKLEAIPVVAADAATAVRTLGPFLQHAQQKIRLAAVEALARCHALAEPASASIVASMQNPRFARVDRDEQAAFYRALGRLGGQSGITFLIDKLANPPKKLFKKKRVVDEQLLAIQGLAEDRTARSLRALEDATLPSRGHSAQVVAACRAAALHVRTPARGGKPA